LLVVEGSASLFSVNRCPKDSFGETVEIFRVLGLREKEIEIILTVLKLT